jgi:signal transduction histidine kinase
VKLRGRLVLVVVATTVPLVCGAVLAMHEVWDRFAVHALRDVALFQMENGGREECERSPATFALPHRDAAGVESVPAPSPRSHAAKVLLPAAQHAEVFAYAASLESANPAAPRFPAELRAELEAGAADAHSFAEADGHRVLLVALRTPWTDGPCAVVLARQGVRPDVRADHDLVVGSALVGIGLAVAVLLAAGPAVGRIRALSAGVRRAAAERWATPVEERGSDEIADLARAFNAAAAEVRAHVAALEARERTLREFVANTDHDLTIPLTVLLGHLAELRRRADAGEPIDVSRIRDASREADYMASLLRNLGVAARLEAGEPDASRATVDLNALVARVVARHLPIATAAGVALESAVPESAILVDGDETLLEQAASNLVHNAVRHNRAGGHVAVTLEAPKSPPATFVLSVADDGPGLSAADRERLAGAATDDVARPRAAAGGGLGLRIVRQVADRHGMRFSLRARDGGGLVAEIRGARRDA